MYRAPLIIGKSLGVSPGAALAKDPNVAIIKVEDLLIIPPRDSNGIVMTGNLVFKPGKFPVMLYNTRTKFKASVETDGEEDAQTAKQKIELSHPGSQKEIREFIQNYIGVDVLILYGSCSTTDKEFFGTKCAPLQLKATFEDDNNGVGHKLMFEQQAKSPYYPAIYQGSLPTASATVITNIAGVEITALNGNYYNIPSSSAGQTMEVDLLTLDGGENVIFIGSGGINPHFIEGGINGSANVNVLLTPGPKWLALQGATITFKVFDGGANKHLVEQNRTA